jgi:ribosomal protein S2
MLSPNDTKSFFEKEAFSKNSTKYYSRDYLDPSLLEYTRGHAFPLSDSTNHNLKKAVLFLSQFKPAPHTILFAGTEDLVSSYITSSSATRCSQSYTSKWVPGLFGNWDSCFQRVSEYSFLEKQVTDLTTSHFKNRKSPHLLIEDKEYLFYINRLKRLSSRWEGIKHLKSRPSVLINLNGTRLSGASKEACRDAVPVIALVDWETQDLGAVNYAIPCDTRNAIAVSFIATVLSSSLIQ